MKKVAFVLSLAALTVFVACNRDDNAVENEILIDDLDLGEYAGYFDDYGTDCLTGPAREDGVCATHRRTAFLVTDGTFDSQDVWPSNYSYILFFVLYSPSEDFTAGTYNVVADWEVFQADYTGEFVGGYYTSAYFPDEFDGCCIGSVEGTIQVSGGLPNITMKFDLSVGYYQYGQEQVRKDENTNAYVDITGQYKGEFLERTIGE